MAKQTANEKRDFDLYFKEIPDADFSPEHNRAVVEATIKKHDQMMARKWKDRIDQYGERADAVVSFLRAVDRGKSNNIETYFGPKEMARLRGDEIREELMEKFRNLNAKKKQKRS